MNKYLVNIPFTGYVSVEVDADSEESAINLALSEGDLDFADVEEVEFHNKICQGNVFNGVLNEAYAELYED